MTKPEFIEKWDDVRAEFRNENDFFSRFTCSVIRRGINSKAVVQYDHLLGNCLLKAGWRCLASDFSKEESKGNDIRLLALEMFYQTCLSFKLYKEF